MAERFRTFKVMDDFNRKVLRIEIDRSLPATRVIRALDELLEVRGKCNGCRSTTVPTDEPGAGRMGAAQRDRAAVHPAR